MNYRCIIVAGAIAIGLYLFSKTKKISDIAAARIAAARKAAARKAAAQKIGKKIGKTVAQKVAPKRIGQPTTQAARIAAARKAAARKAAARKNLIHRAVEVLPGVSLHNLLTVIKPPFIKRIGQPTTQAARIAAARKAAARKAAAQKIGKKIGKTVAQKIPQKVKARRAVMAYYAKRQRPQIQRPRPTKKQIASRLFSGAEKSRIIPYSESSKHSYYGPKSHRLQNEGYGKGQAERERKQALEFRLNELRAMFPESNL